MCLSVKLELPYSPIELYTLCAESIRDGLEAFVNVNHNNLFIICMQLEDLEVTIEDHIQKVLKPNFGAAWDEVGDAYEKEETFSLSTTKTLEGKAIFPLISPTDNYVHFIQV